MSAKTVTRKGQIVTYNATEQQRIEDFEKEHPPEPKIILVPHVLYGSGTPFPIGAFDNREDMEQAIQDLGGKRPSFVLELPLNHNWELDRKKRYQAEARQKQIEEEAKPKPEWTEVPNNDYTNLYRFNPETREYVNVGYVYRMPDPNKARKVWPWRIAPTGTIHIPDVEYKTRKKALSTFKNLLGEGFGIT